MITLLFAAKGGSGTTTVACARAIHSPGPSLLVDLAGDSAAMLGLAATSKPGVVDWLGSNAPAAHLADLVIEAAADLTLLPAHPTDRPVRCSPATVDDERWELLLSWMQRWAHDTGGHVVIDAGTTPLPAVFVDGCSRRWIVTRACFLALRHAGRGDHRPTDVILIEEPGRALRERDVELSTGAKVIVRVAWDPKVARAVDAGLLETRRLPRALRRDLARAA
ncbi:MAG: hypothetical protein AB8G26_07555 [Ilumatobacter sp.]